MAGSGSDMRLRCTPCSVAFKQHFLNFLPLPHGHGSFRRVFIFAIMAELHRQVMQLADALLFVFRSSEAAAIPSAQAFGSTRFLSLPATV